MAIALKQTPRAQNFFERIFGSGSPGAAPAPAPTAVQQPAAAPPSQETKTEEDPFAKFKDLWNVDPNKVNQQNAPIFGDIDPAKLHEAAGKVNFAAGLDNETLQKIRAGGDEGVAAMMAAMNQMSQRSYVQASMAAAKMAETAAQKMEERLAARIPDLVKRSTVSSTLRTDNPLFSRPEVAPIIGALEFQLTSQYPNATPAEISGMAKEYLTGLAKVVSPAPKTDATDDKSGKDSFDWDSFANS
jgi:hypothetical protein